ncbi:MAG: IS66 family insertion sequence element accessory protein TnpB [Lachnospiraceae bacterium]|nr:IS66 family insertion sequence element accessory protein TnpB [Lachnospiraceae bacterium]MBQ5660447.1 IS66 family insertion sequence element accessory protein TnpB [Lachnospiraceae bacterium]MBQ5699593.1 IS66 family insertion sequence element accessory protein TnpB [Lachnospiraceae bacterium]
MDKVTQVKIQFRLEQWKKLISECQASGLSVRSWCQQNDVREQTYYYYLKKIREQTIENLPVPITVPEEKPVTFQKLEVQTPAPDLQATVIIHLPAATIEVRNGTSQQTVEAVLLALRNIC